MSQNQNMTLQATIDKPEPTSESSIRGWLEWPGRACLLAAILVTPWLFGGYYFSAKFLVAVLMLIGLGVLWFEAALSERKSLILPWLLLPMMIGICIVLFQMVPLSAPVDGLLGRQRELYTFLGGSDQTPASISMNAAATWDQLGMLMIALAGVCLGARYFRTAGHAKLLLATGAFNGVAISLFGMVQSLTNGSNGTIYWVVRLLRGGQPFGPYVNRNSAAGYLLICLGCAVGLATIVLTRKAKSKSGFSTKDMPLPTQLKMRFLRFISELNATKLACLLACIVIGTGVLASLSRGGTLSMLIGSFVTLIFFGMARKPSISALVVLPAGLIAIFIACWLGFGAQLIDRIEHDAAKSAKDDVRIQHWVDTYPAVAEFGPLGSGVGAYGQVHRLYRSDQEQAIFVYGENQFFQTMVELGWPGLVLLVIAWLFSWYCSVFLLYRGNSPNSVGLGVAGMFMTTAVAAASCFDFGLYYTANMMFMAVCCGLVAYHAQSLSGRLKKRNWLRYETPALLAKALLLLLFAALSMFALDFYNKWRVESVVQEFPRRTFAMGYPNLDETDRLIEELRPLAESTQNSESLAYMADLFIHRCRLQTKDALAESSETGLSMLDEDANERIWSRTSLDGLHEIVWSLRDDGLLVSAAEFRSADFLRGNLREAKKYLLVNRRTSPMDAKTHLLLAQVNSLVGTSVAASQDAERAVYLAPNKPNVRWVTGLCYLQARQVDKAAVHLKRMMELDPRTFPKVTRIVFHGSNRNLPKVDYDTLVDQVMPDDPVLLYQLAVGFLPENSPQWQRCLDRADDLLEAISASDLKSLKLRSDVKRVKGEIADSIELLDQVLTSNPSNYNAQLDMAKMLFDVGDLEDAKAKVEYVQQLDDDPRRMKRCELILELIKEAVKNSRR